MPRSDLLTYYGFELLDSTVLTETAVNVLINVPVHHTNGFHKFYRAVPVPQPIEDGSTVTRYSCSRSYLLISKIKDNFAEVTEEKLISHCSRSNRLKLCLKLFSMSRSGEFTCLSNLFFDLQTSVLKLCAQQLVALPKNLTRSTWTTQPIWFTRDPVTTDYSTTAHKPSILESGSVAAKIA